MRPQKTRAVASDFCHVRVSMPMAMLIAMAIRSATMPGALEGYKFFFNPDFKKAFNLTLVFYKGAQIADGELTLAALNKKTTKDVKSKADGFKIKASMKVGDAEKLFDANFGVTVQIKDAKGTKLVPNGITIGQAARGEY